jgi:hypothetical protein
MTVTQRITDKEIDLYLSRAEGWHTLYPERVYAMALELKHLRFIMKEFGVTQERLNRELLEAIKMEASNGTTTEGA